MEMIAEMKGNAVGIRRLLLICLSVALVGVLYASVLKALVLDWWQDPNYGHGLVVPLFVAYVVRQEFWRYKKVAFAPSNFGLLVMFGAISLLIVGTLGAELFTSRLSLLILLAGGVIFLAGWEMLHTLAFPLGYLLVAIPLPVIIYNQVTFPLQLMASRLAADCLQLLAVPVLREGNVLFVPRYAMEVAEACSGIRSLTSLVAVAIAYVYLAERRWWARIVLVALMFPIAVVSNGLRIVGAGLLAYLIGPEWAEGFFHLFSGWLIFLTAVGLMLLAHTALVRLGRRNREVVNA